MRGRWSRLPIAAFLEQPQIRCAGAQKKRGFVEQASEVVTPRDDQVALELLPRALARETDGDRWTENPRYDDANHADDKRRVIREPIPAGRRCRQGSQQQ